jgi:hypothetical protein
MNIVEGTIQPKSILNVQLLQVLSKWQDSFGLSKPFSSDFALTVARGHEGKFM